MFTGIVEGTGTVAAVTDDEGGRRLRIETDAVDGLDRGQSVSVSGVCLTVERHEPGAFSVFVAAETADRTYLGTLAAGDRVNLERALRADDRLDGHVVQGHVDGTARVVAVEAVGEDRRLAVDLPGGLARYVVPKGSIALDGVSLTVATLDREAGRLEVALVPETLAATTLSGHEAGDPVHVEVDVLAKYVEGLLAGGGGAPAVAGGPGAGAAPSTVQGAADGASDGTADGADDGDGAHDGAADGGRDGATGGARDGAADRAPDDRD